MFGTWRRSPWFGFQPFFDVADGGGGGGDLSGADDTAHPEYDVDLNAGDDGDDPPRQPAAPAGRQPVQAPARQPGQQPAAGAPGQDGGTPQTYTAEQYSQVANGYRTLHTQNAELRGQLQMLQNQVAALTGIRQPAGGPGTDGQQTQLTEADQKAVAAVYRLFPQLKPLLEKAQDLLSLPDAVNGFRQNDQARWQDIGTRMWEAFDGAVKEAYGNRQLHEFAQKSLDAAFVSWLETDKNAAARYRMGDTGLAKEFMRMYRNGVIVPAQQAGAPGTGQQPGVPRRPGQQQQQPRVPRGGAGSAPVGQQPGQPNVRNADQLHDAAADAYFAARG
jgi:hypothetical protein